MNALVSFDLIKKRLQQIDLFRENPRMAQLEVFHHLVQTARYTEWGRKYGYADISDPDEFRRRVPLQDYEQVKPYVARFNSEAPN